MPRPIGGVMNAEAAHLCQRALFVEKLKYPIDLDKVPVDGHEYIHQVRLEAEQCFPGQRQSFECLPAFRIEEPFYDKADTGKKKVPSLSEWMKNQCLIFTKLALRIKSMRKELTENFPHRIKFPSLRKEKDVCLFCLGSDLYKKIYNTDDVDETPGHLPLLSLVLHLNQEEIFTLLKFTSIWVMQTEFDHKVCRWIYALLACLHKPIPDEWEEFLESFYDFMDCRKKECEEREKYQIYLLSFILKTYFCVKAYALGPSLDSFIQDD